MSQSTNKFITDANLFQTRLQKLFDNWEESLKLNSDINNTNDIVQKLDDTSIQTNSIQSLIICSSQSMQDEDMIYTKTNSIQLWLFGYELANTLLIFLLEKRTLIVVSGKKICSIFESFGKEKSGMQLKFVRKEDLVNGTGDSSEYHWNIKSLLDLLVRPLDGSSNDDVNVDQNTSNKITIAQLSKEIKTFLSTNKNSNSIDTNLNKSTAKASEFGQQILSQISVKKEIFEFVDCSVFISQLLAQKSESEMAYIIDSSRLTSSVMKNYLIFEIETIVDEDRKVQQTELAEKCEDVIFDPMRVQINDLNLDSIEICYNPIIQSGGNYNLKPSAQTLENQFLDYEQGGTILVSLGARYKSYCTNIARTLLFNPSDEQESIYKLLYSVFETCCSVLKDGVVLKDVWQAAIDLIRKEKPELESKFTRNCGFLIGLEFRDSNYIINNKSQKKARKNMVFNLCVGFDKLLDREKHEKGWEKAANWACLIADCVVVEEEKSRILTNCPRKLRNISYVIDDLNQDKLEEEHQQIEGLSSQTSNKEKTAKNLLTNDVLTSKHGHRTRSKTRTVEQRRQQEMMKEEEIKRIENQRKMLQKKHEIALTRLSEWSGDLDNDHDLTRFLSACSDNIDATNGNTNLPQENLDDELLQSYKDVDSIPIAPNHRINVDVNNETVLIQITGCLVPFHISIIKSVHLSEVGQFAFLRLNFQAPSGSLSGNNLVEGGSLSMAHSQLYPSNGTKGTGFMNPVERRIHAHKNETFIRELTIKSMNQRSLDKVAQLIKELKKQALQRKKEKADRDTLVDQEELIVLRDRTNIPRLRDIKIRPIIAGKKKGTGILEAHVNGFRYMNRANGARLDIIYNNIKHAFYQKATEKTISVIIHFNLKNSIMVGRRKTHDIQFYCEVVQTSEEIDMRTNQGDRDGIREEQRERQFRNKMNSMFREFARQSEILIASNKQSKRIQFDVPYEKLSFTGVPDKQSVTIYPTLNCLVALDDTPPFVLTLNEIEIAHFERVQFHIRNFDLVFIFKNLKKSPLHISSIPMESLEPLKQYLNDAGIIYFTGTVNLDWDRVMKQILSNLRGFYESGGWSFLDLDSKSSDEEGGSEDESSRQRRVNNGNNSNVRNETISSDEYHPEEGDPGIDSEQSDVTEGSYASSSSYVSEGEEDSSESEGESRKRKNAGNDLDLSDDDMEDDEEALDWDDMEKQAREDDLKAAYRDRAYDERERQKKHKRPRY